MSKTLNMLVTFNCSRHQIAVTAASIPSCQFTFVSHFISTKLCCADKYVFKWKQAAYWRCCDIRTGSTTTTTAKILRMEARRAWNRKPQPTGHTVTIFRVHRQFYLILSHCVHLQQQKHANLYLNDYFSWRARIYKFMYVCTSTYVHLTMYVFAA